MDRRQKILHYITPQASGIEIAPWFQPLVPKSQGYNVKVVDFFDRKELEARAKGDAFIPQNKIQDIEEVDFVGNASHLDILVERAHLPLASFDYIVSAHNFEHIPDPIRFFQSCSRTLKQGGMLSMIVPDHRITFDCFIPHSITADFLEAYFTKRERPSARQVFAMNSLHARFIRDGNPQLGFTLLDNPSHVKALENLEDAFNSWKEFVKNPDTIYRDTHCWMMSPASLELVLRDLLFLGLINFEIVQIIPPEHDNEMFVHLRNNKNSAIPSRESFYQKRNGLLQRIRDEAAQSTTLVYEMYNQIHQ